MMQAVKLALNSACVCRVCPQLAFDRRHAIKKRSVAVLARRQTRPWLLGRKAAPHIRGNSSLSARRPSSRPQLPRRSFFPVCVGSTACLAVCFKLPLRAHHAIARRAAAAAAAEMLSENQNL
jgi:hypothetical protein